MKIEILIDEKEYSIGRTDEEVELQGVIEKRDNEIARLKREVNSLDGRMDILQDNNQSSSTIISGLEETIIMLQTELANKPYQYQGL